MIETAAIANPRQRRPWFYRAAAQALVLAVVIVLLAFSLHHRAHPWELTFDRPSGLNIDDYRGYSGTLSGGPADLTSDGKLLAIGRPGGTCEVWDISATPRLATTIGDPLPPITESSPKPGIHDVSEVLWLKGDAHIAMRRRWSWEIYEMNGKRVPLGDKAIPWRQTAAASPASPEIAVVGSGKLVVVDASKRELTHEWSARRVNGGDQRLEWAPDARYLLFNDHLGVWMWDLQQDKEIYYHRELDLALPSPMLSDEQSGISGLDNRPRAANTQPATTQSGSIAQSKLATALAAAGRGDFATPVDSRFAPDGSYFATAYRPDDGFVSFGPSNPQGRRLRLYDTPTGNLLWDTSLAADPQTLCFAPDGKRLFVLLDDSNRSERSLIDVYDLESRTLCNRIDLAHIESYPRKIAPLPGGHLAVFGQSLWVVDPDSRRRPVRFPDAHSIVAVLPLPSQTGFVVTARDTSTRIYKLRRDESAIGAFALPETWGIHVGAALLVLGVVRSAGRDTVRSRGKALPRALWAAAVVGGLAFALDIATRVVDICIHDVYEPQGPASGWKSAIPWVLSALFVGSLIGLLRLRRRWWKFCVILAALAALWYGSAAVLMFELLSPRSTDAVPEVVWHGALISPPVANVIVILFVGTAWFSLQLILLLRPSVRAEFALPVRTDDSRRGFPVVNPNIVPTKVPLDSRS